MRKNIEHTLIVFIPCIILISLLLYSMTEEQLKVLGFEQQ
jgi:hypothetical protein